MSLEACLGDLRYPLFHNSACNRRHVKKEAEHGFEDGSWIGLEILVAQPVGWDLCCYLVHGPLVAFLQVLRHLGDPFVPPVGELAMNLLLWH